MSGGGVARLRRVTVWTHRVRRRNVSAPTPASPSAAAINPHGVSVGAPAAVGVADGTGVPSITSQSAKTPTPHVPAEEKLESMQIAQRTLQTKELLAVVKHVTGVPVGHSLQRQHDAPARPGAITSSNRTAFVASARRVSSMTSSRSRSAMLRPISSGIEFPQLDSRDSQRFSHQRGQRASESEWRATPGDLDRLCALCGAPLGAVTTYRLSEAGSVPRAPAAPQATPA